MRACARLPNPSKSRTRCGGTRRPGKRPHSGTRAGCARTGAPDADVSRASACLSCTSSTCSDSPKNGISLVKANARDAAHLAHLPHQLGDVDRGAGLVADSEGTVVGNHLGEDVEDGLSRGSATVV